MRRNAIIVEDASAVAPERLVRRHAKREWTRLVHLLSCVPVALRVVTLDVAGTRAAEASTLEEVCAERSFVASVVAMSHARRRVRRLFEVVSALAGAEIRIAAMVAARWKASVRDVSVNFARPTTATAVAVSARGAARAGADAAPGVE